MHRRFLVGGGLILLAAMSLARGGIGVARAQGEPPAAHATITEFTGPGTCGACHPGAAQEVVQSLHYQHQAAVPYRQGWQDDVLGGMYVTY